MPVLAASCPLLSIIVPIHNVAPYLWACLDSLAKQQVTDFEAILVDDGSTDLSGVIARRFVAQDLRFRLVQNDRAEGPSAARNRGAAEARGRFIAFADADDVVLPDGYARLIAALTASGSSYATGGVERLSGQKRSPSHLHHRLHETEQRGIDLRAAPRLLRDTTCWNKVFRRDFYDQVVGPWPEGMIYEDIAPMTRAMLRADGIDVCAQPVYLWRLREDGTSLTQNRDDMASLEDRFRAIADAFAEIAAAAPDLRDALMWKTLAVDLKVFLRIYRQGSPDWQARLMARCVALLADLSDLHLAELHPAWAALYSLMAQGRLDEAEALLRDARPLETRFLLRATPAGMQAEWAQATGGVWVQGPWQGGESWLPDAAPVLTATALRVDSGAAGLVLRGAVSLGPVRLRRSPAPDLWLDLCGAAGQVLARREVAFDPAPEGRAPLALAGPDLGQGFTAHLPMALLQEMVRLQEGPFHLRLSCRFGDELAHLRLRVERPAPRPEGKWATPRDPSRPEAEQLGMVVSADAEGHLALYLQRRPAPPPPRPPVPAPPKGWRRLLRRLRRGPVRPALAEPAPAPLPPPISLPTSLPRHHVTRSFAETGFVLRFDPPLPQGAGPDQAYLVAQDRPGLALPLTLTPEGGLWLDLRQMAVPGRPGRLPAGRYDLLDGSGAPILVQRLEGPAVIWLQDMRHEVLQSRDRLQLSVRSHVPGHALPERMQRLRREIWPIPETADPRPVLLLESAGGRRIGGRPLEVLRAVQAAGAGFRPVFVEANAAVPDAPLAAGLGITRVRRSSAQYWQALHQAAALVIDGPLPPGAYAREGLCILQTGTGFEETPGDLPLHEAAIWAGLIAPAGAFGTGIATGTGFCGQYFGEAAVFDRALWQPEPDLVLLVLRDRARLGPDLLRATVPDLPQDAAGRPLRLHLLALGGEIADKTRLPARPLILDRSDDPEAAGLLARAAVVVSDSAAICAALQDQGRPTLHLSGPMAAADLLSALAVLRAEGAPSAKTAASAPGIPEGCAQAAQWLRQILPQGLTQDLAQGRVPSATRSGARSAVRSGG